MRRLARAACVSTGAAAVLLCGSGTPAAADDGWGSPWEVPSEWEVPQTVGDHQPGWAGGWADPWRWGADAPGPEDGSVSAADARQEWHERRNRMRAREEQ
ncbi:hypothetical protein ACFF2X_35810, partial [Cryptosporangium minutisporangium]